MKLINLEIWFLFYFYLNNSNAMRSHRIIQTAVRVHLYEVFNAKGNSEWAHHLTKWAPRFESETSHRTILTYFASKRRPRQKIESETLNQVMCSFRISVTLKTCSVCVSGLGKYFYFVASYYSLSASPTSSRSFVWFTDGFRVGFRAG